MNKSERLALLIARLTAMGFTLSEIQRLRRIEGTLRRWSEAECNGEIQRDDETGKPYYRYDGPNVTNGPAIIYVPDREAAALKRLAAIMESHPDVLAYHQTDPRGCALYLVERRDLVTDDNQIVAKARSHGATIEEVNHDLGSFRLTSPNAGGFYHSAEKAALTFLKARGLKVPPRNLLPLEQYYTRGVAVCA
jgi:hypothetical protein